ncbi:MAG: MaoC family dehydratase N-terminal domain-containing protein [Pseudomonadales bacterium]|nr:MaoC family dehydratase N-terminal domain-containing protein [Halioglobus sp.]MCP5194729.1 MaoC family dehydratase N-terminal domain-containing protein [Pseudomonadales bacterium]
MSTHFKKAPDQALLAQHIGKRLGPYNSFNPVSRVQIWQWCSVIGDKSPLYLDDNYHENFGMGKAVAPPAMMQMWTMRDVNMQYAPGSTDDHPYQIMADLESCGFLGNVAVSYDISFHRYLEEGDRAHHYTTVVSISDLKSTALGQGYFFTERVEYLDQNDQLFAEALITYFQYQTNGEPTAERTENPAVKPTPAPQSTWQPDFKDLDCAQLNVGDVLPALVIPITHKLIVAGAIATQDFIPVHHNVPAAREAGMPDIFMNILTTSGLSARYLSDWAGPGSRLRRIQFKLMAPNTPGDTMTLQGRVSAVEHDEGECIVGVEFSGMNRQGPHVMGSATLALAH